MNNNTKVILFILLAVYAILGLIHCSNQGFWHDEIYTLTFLKGISAYNFEGSTLYSMNHEFHIQFLKNLFQKDNFITNFPIQILHEGHPPLYFLILKPWAILFGYSELSLRSFSLLSGLLSTLVLFFTIKDNFKGKYIPWVILLLIIFNPFLFYFFTEARMYAFAFLMATLSFKYWLKYLNNKVFNSYHFFIFTLCSAALLYTHYYGLFFILTLVFLDFIKNGFSYKLFHYSIPILIFLPWSIMLKAQLGYHDIHWTDGAFSFIDSLKGFGYNIINLFFSPMSEIKVYELVFAILMTISLFIFGRHSWRNILAFLSVLFFYFFQIFLFDQIFDHHTIIVPRYYIFIIILILWAIIESIHNGHKVFGITLMISYCLIAGNATYEIYSSSRAPKQMYQELAAYIDSGHDPKNTLIVVEPKGAMLWGLANYLKGDYSIISAKDYKTISNNKKVVFVDEMLGVGFREGNLNNEEQQKLNLVPFVGVFLYE
jgi:uncharacterized membrane protein